MTPHREIAMRHQESTARTADGLLLYSQTWLPDGEPKGMIAFAHGGGEHSGRYAHLGATLVNADYALHMVDLRGHGRSPGRRGHLMSWPEYHHDMAATLDGARQIAPGVAHFFGGHSLGGLIAASVALDGPQGCHGVILSGPFFRPAWKPTPWKLALARLLSNLMPGLTLDNDFDPSTVSRSAEVVRAYRADPLVHDNVNTRGAVVILATQEIVLSRAAECSLPLLILQAGEDRLAAVPATREFFNAASSPDKTLRLYDGLYHEVFNEPEQDRVLADLIAWLDARVERLV
jgi:alpha-beta hydrolase superfamily lysophospholipase